MNKARRKQITAAQSRVSSVQADLVALVDGVETPEDVAAFLALRKTQLENAADELESITNEEEEYLDNMPEGLQESHYGETAENAIENLSNAYSQIREILDDLDNTDEFIEETYESFFEALTEIDQYLDEARQ